MKFARQQLDRILSKVDQILVAEIVVEPTIRFDEIKPGPTSFSGGSSSSIGVASTLTEVRDVDGSLIGFHGGTAEEREAALDAAAKGAG